MEGREILKTERLILREIIIEDAEFILKLLTADTFLEYIGDKGVKSLDDAKDYIKNFYRVSYETNGFGLWLIELKQNKTPIGMCGLVNRETLEDIDIGFALLPKYEKKGYAFEAANATMNYAKNKLGIKKIVGITSSKNNSSITLLNKIGLQFEKTVELSKNDRALLFSPFQGENDKKEIDAITNRFFSIFSNKGDQTPSLERIKDIFIPEGSIINNTYNTPDTYTLDSFIVPRKKILSDGTLVGFSEQEIFEKTYIFQNIAQRISLYEKTGILNGKPFETKGTKTIQFIKVNQQWKMTSVVWSDERTN